MGGMAVMEQVAGASILNLGTYPVIKECKITRRREQIFRILAGSHGRHLSAYDIYGELKKEDHLAGMATVYRTLELFTKAGLVRAIDMGDGCKRYELSFGREGNCGRHLHLVCIKCGNVIEMEIDMSKMLKPQLDEAGFEVDDIALMITGYCKKCRTDTS